MGIRNLNRWLDWVGRKGVGIVEWPRFRGKAVGIDILSFLYRSKQQQESPLLTVAQLISDLRRYDIEPIIVFDGKTPAEKIGRRKAATPTVPTATADPPASPVRVSADDRNLVKNFLYTCGVLALNAEQEADSVLAFMARTQKVAAVVSSDTDFLARGIEHLILPPPIEPTPSHLWKYIHMPTLLDEAGISYDQFVVMCVLIGCDYTPTIPTISYQSAYWAVRRGGGAAMETQGAILQREGISTTTPWESAVAILRGDRDSWDTLLAPKQHEKWLAGAPAPEPDALDGMLEALGFPHKPADLLPRASDTNGTGTRSGGNSCSNEFYRSCTGSTAPYNNPECSYG
jgi:5'-3' exonuclease